MMSLGERVGRSLRACCWVDGRVDGRVGGWVGGWVGLEWFENGLGCRLMWLRSNRWNLYEESKRLKGGRMGKVSKMSQMSQHSPRGSRFRSQGRP